MVFDPVALVRHYHDCLNRFNAADVEPLFALHATYHSPGVGALNGRAAIMAAMRSYFAEYSDQVASDDRIEAQGTHAARSVWHLRATSATRGQSCERKGIEIITFDHEGLIICVEVEDR